MKSFAELAAARQAKIDKVYSGLDAANLTPAEQDEAASKVAEINEKANEAFESLRTDLIVLDDEALKTQLSEWGFEKPPQLRKKESIVNAYFEHERSK